jgi:hypothetical protein
VTSAENGHCVKSDALNNKYAWLVPARTWNRLHYVPGVTFEDWDVWWDTTTPKTMTAVCGLVFDADLPGIFSRIGCPRCAHCCRAVGIPRGHGAALNDEALDATRSEHQ